METLPIENQKKANKRSGCRRYFLMGILVFIILGGGYIYWNYYNVFGDGVKSGILKNVVRKGQVFKTFEGELIQAGIKGALGGGAQSNNFVFSIENKRIYDTLAIHSGKRFDLHYKEYRGVLPWRGNTVYIVDSIISMTDGGVSPF
ncbi:hypothetical protein LQ567_10375 [Niabella pedocola]|uniref:6-phosphogluconate dehydrogenase n=1 Tax=Niabella pedocola TaxID=1752077 RepID=A0ABS8PQ14_9BACT|nr:hypothetical protein [Niabella pedocola]MCD2423170.1 hypothetical protein [Niabella pedocola]